MRVHVRGVMSYSANKTRLFANPGLLRAGLLRPLEYFCNCVARILSKASAPKNFVQRSSHSSALLLICSEKKTNKNDAETDVRF